MLTPNVDIVPVIVTHWCLLTGAEYSSSLCGALQVAHGEGPFEEASSLDSNNRQQRRCVSPAPHLISFNCRITTSWSGATTTCCPSRSPKSSRRSTKNTSSRGRTSSGPTPSHRECVIEWPTTPPHPCLCTCVITHHVVQISAVPRNRLNHQAAAKRRTEILRPFNPSTTTDRPALRLVFPRVKGNITPFSPCRNAFDVSHGRQSVYPLSMTRGHANLLKQKVIFEVRSRANGKHSRLSDASQKKSSVLLCVAFTLFAFCLRANPTVVLGHTSKVTVALCYELVFCCSRQNFHRQTNVQSTCGCRSYLLAQLFLDSSS